MIALRTLNGFEVRKQTADQSSRLHLAPQQSALLVYLALGRFGRRSRDQVVALLWPELPDSRAREALNQAVFRLRELLGYEVVTRDGDNLQLDQVQCDAVQFEAALHDQHLEAALELYAGDLLAGVYLSQSGEYERWVDEEREQLRSRAVTAALALARREERTNPVSAVSRLRQVLAWSPYEEPAVRDLVRLLVELGDRAGAVRAYESFRARLETDLNLPAPGDLEQYVRVVREGGAGISPPNGALSAAGVPLSSPEGTAGSSASGAKSVGPIQVQRASRFLHIALPLGGLVMVGAAVLLLTKEGKPAPAAEVPLNRRIAVTSFASETPDTKQSILGSMATAELTEGLSQTGLAEVVAVPADSTVRGAGIVVSGSYLQIGDSVVFKVRITDAGSGTLLTGAVEAVGSASRPGPVVKLLGQRTLGALAPLLDERLASWARVASRPPSFEAYQLYVTGLDRPLGTRSAAEREEYLLRAAALDSSFTAPLIWALSLAAEAAHAARAESLLQVLEPRRAGLAPWDRAMLDHNLARVRGNFPEAYSAMRRVVELAPNSEWELELAYWALWTNRLKEAVERLRRLDPEQRLRPYQPRRYWFILLAARHLIGDFEGVLSDVARMRRSHVEDLLGSSHELAALAAMGRVAQVEALVDGLLSSDNRSEARRVLDAAMEFRVHGYSDAAKRLLQRLTDWYAARPVAGVSYVEQTAVAVALFAAGRIAEARPLFERTMVEDTMRWTPRGFLGQIAARQRDRATAERELQFQLSQAERSGGGEAVIHAAAIAAELGDSARAVQLTRRAISRGFYYNHPSVHSQPRLEVLWRIPAARALLRPIG